MMNTDCTEPGAAAMPSGNVEHPIQNQTTMEAICQKVDQVVMVAVVTVLVARAVVAAGALAAGQEHAASKPYISK